ncbi:MAG: hypothetical protein JBO36_15485 [Candidatus Thiodiazotropha taylori]|nr:hypothetical protein [Candidatus Thiodiazotropha taylori]
MEETLQVLSDYKSIFILAGIATLILAIVSPITTNWFVIKIQKYQRVFLFVLGAAFLSLGLYIALSFNEESLPKGSIISWDPVIRDSSGKDTKQRRPIPKGWKVCDGTNGTPDLQNYFLMGADSSASTGEKGGVAKTTGLKAIGHALTIEQIPSHRHNIVGNFDGHGGLNVGPGKMTVPTVTENPLQIAKKKISLWNSGGGQKHSHNIKDVDNRPPFYKIIYIIKVD